MYTMQVQLITFTLIMFDNISVNNMCDTVIATDTAARLVSYSCLIIYSSKDLLCGYWPFGLAISIAIFETSF